MVLRKGHDMELRLEQVLGEVLVGARIGFEEGRGVGSLKGMEWCDANVGTGNGDMMANIVVVLEVER
jgi:hypothetical protein